jgi:signal transduction histidine kinase
MPCAARENSVVIVDDGKFVKIKVSDSGKGIPKNQFKSVFEPGFTTKKRGWGLGLSLTKRIVEEYHKGKIKVLQSEVNKGTTMQVFLASSDSQTKNIRLCRLIEKYCLS